MIQRMSTMFLRTLREDPADAEVPSHRLLVRAGYIRRVAPGIFSWLPLGWRVYQNIERIVREEMDAIGAQEIHLPALLPREPYEKTNRWTEYGDGIFRLKDRKGNDMLLGPTHEEIFALTVKEVFSSYKDLPVSLYQIQWKYRDEQRPRAGILRGREFSMKDSYSFDIDEAGLERSYYMHREVYKKTFDRLGLEYVPVRAHSGAMGGSLSEEFLTPADSGEDAYVRCTNCDYAGNTEAVEVPVPDAIPYEGLPAAHVEETPDTPTIDSLVDLLNAKYRRDDRGWRASDTLKNVALKVTDPTGETSVLVIGVPGDREIDEKRLEAQLYPSTFETLGEEDFTKHPELVRGYIGPQALGETEPGGIRYLVDPRVVSGTQWVTGANDPGRHVLDLVAGRDFQPDGTILAAEVREDDPCPRCGAMLEMARGIEIAHVFALGTKYAEALGVSVLDENGKQITVSMGSYGLGVSRLVAVIAENNHDGKGLIWPREVSPFDVHVVATGKSDEPFDAAEKLAADLEAAGVQVLLDDRRGATAGEKFNDADLIGVPTIVVCGRRIVDGKVEIKDRRTSERIDVPLEEAVAHLTR